MVQHTIVSIVDELLDELEQILTGITLVGELTTKTLDRIAGIGERISSQYYSTIYWRRSVLILQNLLLPTAILEEQWWIFHLPIQI